MGVWGCGGGGWKFLLTENKKFAKKCSWGLKTQQKNNWGGERKISLGGFPGGCTPISDLYGYVRPQTPHYLP